MKLFFTYLAIIGSLGIVPVFAQEKTSPETDEPVVAQPINAAAPRATQPATSPPQAADSESATPRDTSPRPLPAETIPATPKTETVTTQAAPPTETSEPTQFDLETFGVFAAAAAAILGGISAYRIKKKTDKKRKENESRDESKCMNFKQMMEEKIAEITDLKAKIKKEFEERARQTIREELADTKAGELLRQIERGEKEYQQLKKLFEECMVEVKLEKENIILQRATTSDIPLLITVEKSVSGSRTFSPILEKAEWEKEFGKDRVVYLVKKGEMVIGDVSYERRPDSSAHISGLAIEPAFQSKGIGREVLRRILEELKDVKKIDLVTHPENLPAVKLYKSFGFTIESRKENYYGDGEPRLILVLKR